MINTEIIRRNLSNTLEKTELNIGDKYEGKVRDNYILRGKRIIVTTDRISAFDKVLGTIPFKGQVLNQLAAFWFDKTKNIIKNHMIDVPDPNVMVVTECRPIAIEMVVRGYMTGVTTTSAWYNYQNGVRNFCGNRLPEGMRKDQRFERPIITPTTKAGKGEHDRPVSGDEAIEEGLVTKDLFEKMSEVSLMLFDFGSRFVAKHGLILVDTKYEFGLLDGELVLMDEIHTPDSSRFWFADTYDELFRKGEEQRKLDKEYVRTWLANQGYLGDGKPPVLTDEVKIEAARRYIEAYEKITGKKFEVTEGNVAERIRENLENKGYLKKFKK
ncbi:MAG: phosphoribosylaminoimidazolesuccinocarboxamide synthase [Candidatus Aenigmarchaeota archaeon]|nr:phosphoribosylaminoimidazolesuccinocarboxamide synthase [Candidatus Aenigmarchaeota archaeon]